MFNTSGDTATGGWSYPDEEDGVVEVGTYAIRIYNGYIILDNNYKQEKR